MRRPCSKIDYKNVVTQGIVNKKGLICCMDRDNVFPGIGNEDGFISSKAGPLQTARSKRTWLPLGRSAKQARSGQHEARGRHAERLRLVF